MNHRCRLIYFLLVALQLLGKRKNFLRRIRPKEMMKEEFL
jgi:hypothetical protein